MLYIGLLTEADDHGLFEWKPLQLKMRLLPADMADVVVLLAELVGVDLIREIDASGKALGAIRRFGRHQKPRRPSFQFDLPPEIAEYVCADDLTPEGGGGLFPTKSGIENHKEQEQEQEQEQEGETPAVEAREKVVSFPAIAPSNDWPDNWMEDLCARGNGWLDLHKNGRLITGSSIVAQWKLNGFSYELDVAPTIEAICRKRRSRIGGWEYFNDAVRGAVAHRQRAAEPISDADLDHHRGPRHDDKHTRRQENERRSDVAVERLTAFVRDHSGGGFGDD